MYFSLGSKAKSLKTNSLVVINAIVTLRLITGGIISDIARSSAVATKLRYSEATNLSVANF